jgi:transcriptional regulator with XRE-family HTH domain
VADASYAAVIVRNIRALRARKNLDQADVVERMRGLGFTNWHRQTLSRVEQGNRKLLAEELLALAYALDTSMEAMLAPAADERGYIKLGGGAVHMEHAAARVRGVADGAIRWNGDAPVFMVNMAGMSGEAAADDYFAAPAPSEEAG